MKRGLRQKPLSHLNCFIKKKKKSILKKKSFGFDELLVKHRLNVSRLLPAPPALASGSAFPPSGIPAPAWGIPAAGRGAGSPRDGISWGATSCPTPGLGGMPGLAGTQAALAFSMCNNSMLLKPLVFRLFPPGCSKTERVFSCMSRAGIF